MSRIKTPAGIPDLVRATFAKALEAGELNYYPTRVTILKANSIPFQLRFSPALANKPKGPPPDPAKKHFDPFANPPAALKVTDLSPSHYLVLNKFAVVQEHFILATTAYKQQTHVLEPADLDATRACIEAYSAAGGLFAFFNCGEHSGASQPHRHIQLLPVERMREGLEGDGEEWDMLADRLGDGDVAPFRTFTEKISLEMTGAQLWEVYLRLYRQACRAVNTHTGKGDAGVAPSEGEAWISYNMAMTKSTLTICPRLSEGQEIRGSDGGVAGKLALNGTVLAGTALVKSEKEWDALRADNEGLIGVLGAIGLPTQVD